MKRLKRRKWHYILPPSAYDVFCDKCGGGNTYWSEYEHKIWCFDCQIDTDGTLGVFGGPIPLHAAYMLGLTFDRFNLETKQIDKLNLDSAKGKELVWDPPEVWENVSGTRAVVKRLLKDEEPSDTYGELTREIGSKYFKLVPRKTKRKKDGNIRPAR
jgi:hypothetical protein